MTLEDQNVQVERWISPVRLRCGHQEQGGKRNERNECPLTENHFWLRLLDNVPDGENNFALID